MALTIKQKIDNCELLKYKLQLHKQTNKVLFICTITEYSPDFPSDFNKFIKRQMRLIDTGYKDLYHTTLSYKQNESIKESIKGTRGVWEHNDLNHRIEFIDRVISTLKNK